MDKDLEQLHHQIELLVERQRYGEAKRLLAQAFNLQPDHTQNYLFAGQIAVETEDFGSARKNLEHVLSVDPDNYFARVFLYRLFCGTEQYVEAERVINGLLKDYPDFAYLYGLYGRLMLVTMHIDRAGALAREGLRLDPSDEQSRIVSLLVDVIENRSEDAAAHLKAMVRESPEALHVAWMVAVVLQAHHRNSEAFEVMRGILKAAPDDPDVIEALVGLRVVSHWTMKPLAPLQRYGWGGVAATWGIAILAAYLADRFAPAAMLPLFAFYLAYVVYSWVWPPLLKRWLAARGF